MSRHVPRSARWSRHGPNEYTSADAAVRFERGAWWALVTYRQLPAEQTLPARPDEWQAHADRLGPFKRPRNAMMAAEEHATLLRRRHGERVAFQNPAAPG